MRTILGILLTCLLVPSAALADDNPLSKHNKFLYTMLQRILLRAAETMPEASYAFKPTPKVRSYGEVVAHIADSQYVFCSVVLGVKNPAPAIEKNKTSKAELLAALKESFLYCDKAYDGMTDATATEMVKLHGGSPKLGVLTINNIHSTEHYGNLVTYLRLKDIVPPTSDPEFMKQLGQ